MNWQDAQKDGWVTRRCYAVWDCMGDLLFEADTMEALEGEAAVQTDEYGDPYTVDDSENVTRREYYHPAQFIERQLDEYEVHKYIDDVPCLQEKHCIPDRIKEAMYALMDDPEVDLLVWDDLKLVPWDRRRELMGDGWK
jgi:hypothetical protein